MHWTTKVYCDGEVRKRKFFAWLPVSFYNSAKGVKEHFWLEKVQTTERRDEHWWTVCNIIAGRKLEKEELDDHIQDWGKRHPEEVAAIKKPTEKSNLDIDREGL